MSNHIGDLTPDPKNARRHTPRNVGMLVEALHEVGAARSIVIDEQGVVLAGNATLEAAGQAGIERLRIIDADGDEIIAVRRTGLTDEQKTKLALYDNRVAELAEWDTEVLSAIADEQTADLDDFWFPSELEDLLEDTPNRGTARGSTEVAFTATPEDGQPASPSGHGEMVTCPECGHRFEV